MKTSLVGLTLALAGAATWVHSAQTNRTVDVAVKPGDAWKAYPTRSVSDLPDVPVITAADLDAYGGWRARPAKATGFFYPTNQHGRWWLVTPDGNLFLHQGVTSVSPLRSPGAEEVFNRRFGSIGNWADRTTDLLREQGFNGLGSWSTDQTLRQAKRPLVYTKVWNFMSSYGRKRGGTYQKPGHTGYPQDCIFVFDREFEAFCDEHAQQLAATSRDPWLLGHFSDNEMPLKREALKNYLSLPPTDPGYQAADKWLKSRRGPEATLKDATEQDQIDFLAYVVDRYFRIVSGAIKKHDPNHLYLGARFHGSDLRYPEIFRAAGRYLDVVSVNYYRAWTPDPEKLRMWERESRRPIIITEWYAKGMDSGLANTSGAGWLVKTQRDRGLFYENFVLGLLESPVCVGWHWFKYIDNDPADTRADPSNRDSNKGILTNRYEPYRPLLDSMKAVNLRAYSIVDYFDRASVK